MSTEIPSPEKFFGHKMGADQKLARWNRIVEYFWELDKSPCVKVEDLGKSTEGNPFLLVTISSPENIKNLEKIRKMCLKLAYSEDLTEEEATSLIKTGKTVVVMSMSLHASETGGTQMAPELVYELLTGDSLDIKQILDEVVLLLFPCANPDGNIMIVDWYNKWLGTEYEGCPMPWLYHKYAGHDNNRDQVMLNLVESRMLTKATYLDWFPQAHIDFHQMGSYGARFYLPPYSNPTDPNVDPLVWTEQQLYGGAMLIRLEQRGKTGVENQADFAAEFLPAYIRVSVYHNICGMTSESASVKLATPIYVHYHQLQPARAGRGRPEYRAQVNFPHPWLGGWWRLRDIVEQQKISALATLEAAAKYREAILYNLYLKAKRSTEKGRSESPFAFVFPPYQHDPLTALKLLKSLVNIGVKIHVTEKEFAIEGFSYPKGTYVIFLSQITRPLLLNILRWNLYHQSAWSRTPEGEPIQPHDLASYNMAELMGVKVVEIAKPFEGSFEQVQTIKFPSGSIEVGSGSGYIIDGRLNDSFKAVNRLLKKDVKVYRVEEDVKTNKAFFQSGSFYIPPQEDVTKVLNEIAEELHLTFYLLSSPSNFKKHEIKPLRIAIYQRYYSGNMDEGWTRWLFEQYEFGYNTVMDKEIKEGLKEKYDVLILPSDPTSLITGENLQEYYEKRGRGSMVPPKYPPEYRSGIGNEEVEKVREFVETGGTLITLNEASNFALEKLDLPVKNVLKDLKPTDFFCPGSTLKVLIDRNNPLSYGVAEDSFVLFRNGVAFEIKQTTNNEDYKVVVSYPDEQILQSGWLAGERYLSRKAALIDVIYGKGRIVLFGFPPQFRAQTHATFKFLFNALFS